MATAAADIFIDEPLVRRLLVEQHPDLRDLELRPVAHGWDNDLYRLGNELVVRLPRRMVAASLIEHEQRWLPGIAERVPVSVPVPVRVGIPSETFPWPWSVTPWFEGTPASETAPGSLDELAAELASFVRDLQIPAPADAPHNPLRGVPLAARDRALRNYLASGLVPRAIEVESAWSHALEAAQWPHAPVWLHGDLHPANFLLRGGHLAAVLDFGDVTAGDPASDLATAWLTFDGSGRERFRAGLDYDEDTWRRARAWALVLSAAFLANAAVTPSMREIGLHGIQQVLGEAS
jgi:aminoglycoside phosphotransferase (APT) family kinase protein